MRRSRRGRRGGAAPGEGPARTEVSRRPAASRRARRLRRTGAALGTVLAAASGACAPAAEGPETGAEAGRDAKEETLFRDPGGFSGLPDVPKATASSAFWGHWGDGRAELSGYRLVTRRYGELREGEVVLIYVTEPHDRRVWIKDDDAREPHRAEVLKLNVHREFLAGIYPYSVLTGVFAPVDDWDVERFSPVKLTMTAHEWCGSYFAGVWPGPGRFRALRLSYFPEEGERAGLVPAAEGALYEDALLIQLRELDGPFARGGDWEGSLVPSLWEVRRGHRDLEPGPATLTRREGEREGVPVTRFVLRHGGRTRTFEVERAPPRRVLGWRIQEGGAELEEARLLRTVRLPYWRLNAPGDEAYRAELGLGTARAESGAAPGSASRSTPGSASSSARPSASGSPDARPRPYGNEGC